MGVMRNDEEGLDDDARAQREYYRFKKMEKMCYMCLCASFKKF